MRTGTLADPKWYTLECWGWISAWGKALGLKYVSSLEKEPQQFREPVAQTVCKNGCSYFPLRSLISDNVASQLLPTRGHVYFPPLNLGCLVNGSGQQDVMGVMLDPCRAKDSIGFAHFHPPAWISIYENRPGLAC